jgi:predicted MFS family arabinose efflux permease
MPATNREFILILLAIINFTHIVDSMLIMPLGDIFISIFNINASQYSLLVSAYAIAAFVSSLAGIFILDKVDRRTALMVLYTGFSVATLCSALADSFMTLIIIRLATGFFGGMIGALLLSVISDLFMFKERGRAMGVLFAAFSVASALGIPIGIYLAALSTWQLPFIIIGTLGLLITLLIWFVFPSMNTHIKPDTGRRIDFAPLISIFRDRNQMKALSAAFVLILAHFMIIPFISPYMIKNVGFTQEQISYQFLFGGIATVFSSPYVGRLTDRFGAMKIFGLMLLLSFIPTLIITQLGLVPVAVALIYTTLFFIFGSGRMIAPNTLITAAAPPELRGSFMSLKSATQQLAIGISAWLSGHIVIIGSDGLYKNYQYVGYLSIVFGLFTIWLVSRIRVAHGN